MKKPRAPKKSKKSKAKKPKKEETKEDVVNGVSESEGEDEKPEIRKVILKGKAVVDPHFPLDQRTCQVYQTAGKVYDCTMNQSSI